ncbi:MAG TPA: flotillin-like FloA family protein, partial [Sphingomonadales bacterium]|nr:flotillin-like FloA family protein [Sphingomonadales bacterium]
MNPSSVVVGILFIVAFIVGLFVVIIIASFFKTWLRAKVSGAPVTFLELIGLWLQRVPIALVVDCRVMSVKAGIELPLADLQAHYMAGGDVFHTVQALIAADKAGLNLDFRRAAAIDLATKQSGKNVYSAV